MQTSCICKGHPIRDGWLTCSYLFGFLPAPRAGQTGGAVGSCGNASDSDRRSPKISTLTCRPRYTIDLAKKYLDAHVEVKGFHNPCIGLRSPSSCRSSVCPSFISSFVLLCLDFMRFLLRLTRIIVKTETLSSLPTHLEYTDNLVKPATYRAQLDVRLARTLLS